MQKLKNYRENLSISFCLPTYKRNDLLVQAVNSIINTRHIHSINYEINISDDDGENNLGYIFSDNFIKNNNIKLLANKVHGQFENLNSLIENSQFDWVCFLHDDDLLGSDFLDNVFEQIDDQIDLVWGARNIINEQGVSLRLLKPKKLMASFRGYSRNYIKDWFVNGDSTFAGNVIPPMITGLIVRKELLHRVGKFPVNLRVMGDGLMLFKLLIEANKFLFINKILVNYRISGGTERTSLSSSGVVYSEYLDHLKYGLQFLIEKDKNIDHNFVAKCQKRIYLGCLSINGPITWLALHFKGPFSEKFKIILNILHENYKFSPRMTFLNFPIVPISLNFFPKFALKFFSKIYIGY